MDRVKSLIEKAESNISSANLLFNNGQHYGLAAFHAQQCLELSIKAFCIKYGFEQYIKDKNLKFTHDPAKTLLSHYFNHIIDISNKMDRRNLDREIETGIDETIKILEISRDVLKKAERKPKFQKQLWKFSLRLSYESDILKKYSESIKNYSEKQIPVKMMNKIFNDVREYVSPILEKFVKDRSNRQKYNQKIAEIEEEILKPWGLTKTIIPLLFNKKSDDWKDEINKALQNKNIYEMFKLLFGPNGTTSKIQTSKKSDEHANTRLLWVISAISIITIFTFPHAVLGRYPDNIDQKSTEKLYVENAQILKKIIDESASIHNMIKSML